MLHPTRRIQRRRNLIPKMIQQNDSRYWRLPNKIKCFIMLRMPLIEMGDTFLPCMGGMLLSGMGDIWFCLVWEKYGFVWFGRHMVLSCMGVMVLCCLMGAQSSLRDSCKGRFPGGHTRNSAPCSCLAEASRCRLSWCSAIEIWWCSAIAVWWIPFCLPKVPCLHTAALKNFTGLFSLVLLEHSLYRQHLPIDV